MDVRQIPPQDITAEMAVLGAIFIDGTAVDRVHELMSADDFFRESHRKIFRSMAELHDKNEPIDLVTLATLLQGRKELEEVGGGAYLASLVEYVPTAANIAFYCKIVAEKSLRRRLLTGSMDASRMIYEDAPTEEVVAFIETSITQLPTNKQASEPVDARQAIRETFKTIEGRCERRGEIQGIPYGIPELDTATNGMQRGDLIIIAGRPSMGKSALAGNVIASVCHSGLSALLFSLEMSRENCTERMIACHGNASYTQLRSGIIHDSTWPKMMKAADDIAKWNWHIDDTPGITLSAMRSKAKRQKRKGLDLIAIDYLQLMGVSSKDNRSQSLGEISRGLKKLARELDVPVVLLSQLNRGLESRTDKRPVMSDLRDSGEIEQDADVILFPYRPAVYCPLCRDKKDDASHNTREHQAKAEIIIEKQRNGERNISIQVAWIGDNQKFIGIG